jgi:curved DNA-binding protein CbpA
VIRPGRVDPYAVLGVAASATDAEIRAAYRRAAQLAHPDRVGNASASTEDMAAINDAWRVLRDPALRAQYDGGDAPRTTESSTGPQGTGVTPVRGLRSVLIVTMAFCIVVIVVFTLIAFAQSG